MRISQLVPGLVGGLLVEAARGPFLEQVDALTWVFGNDLFNVTQSESFATKVYYRGKELVGTAKGHYIGTDQETNFVWTSANVVSKGEDYIDISFNSAHGELHWVVFDGLAGAYNYFVNRDLYDSALIRTLWRLDPKLFRNGRTYLRDEPLPNIEDILASPEIQDQTWQLADGSYVTKYDFTDFAQERDFFGIYGPEVGSWWIHAGKDYLPGGPLSQTLTVRLLNLPHDHEES